MSRVMDAQRVEAYAEMLRQAPTDPTDGEFDDLPADAAATARQDPAERMLPYLGRIQAEYPQLKAPDTHTPRGAGSVTEIATAAMQELYNPAQADVGMAHAA